MQIEDLMLPRHLTISDFEDNDEEDLPNSLLDKISEEGNFDVFTKEDSIDNWDRLEKPRHTSPHVNFGDEREIFEKGLRDGAGLHNGSSSSEKTIGAPPTSRRNANPLHFVDLNIIGNDRALRRKDSSDEETNAALAQGQQSHRNLNKIKEDSEEEDEARSERVADELAVLKPMNLASSLYLKSEYKASPEQRSHPLKDRPPGESSKHWPRTHSSKLGIPLQVKPRLSAHLTSKQLAKRPAEKPIHIDLGTPGRQFKADGFKKHASSPRAATSKDRIQTQAPDPEPRNDLRLSQLTIASKQAKPASWQAQDGCQQADSSSTKPATAAKKAQPQSAGLSSIRNLAQPRNKELFCRRPFIEINKSKPSTKTSPRMPICAAVNSRASNPKKEAEQEQRVHESHAAANNVQASLYDTQGLSNSQCIVATPLTVNTQSASSSRLSHTCFQLDKYSFNKSHNDIKSRLEKSTSSRGVASITAGHKGPGYDNLYEKRKQYAGRAVYNHPLFLASCDRRAKQDRLSQLDASKEQKPQPAFGSHSQSSCKSLRKASVRSCYSSTKKNQFARNGESNSPKQSETKGKFSHYFNLFQKETLPTQCIYDRRTPEDDDQSSELFKEKNAIYAKKASAMARPASRSKEKPQATQAIVPINLKTHARFGSAAVPVDPYRSAAKEPTPSLEQAEKNLKDSEDPR